jgi:putative chitinase
MENAARAQQRLVDQGYALDVDGDFGEASFAALMSFIGGKAPVTLLRLELGRAADRHFPSAGIDRALRVAHALAQQSVETGGFSKMVESLNYSVDGLRKTFSRARISEADCQRLGRKPGEPALSLARQAEIANIVYGGTFGLRQLGNRNPGDGFKYRGRGAKQTTGLTNYANVANLTGIDVVTQPERLENPDTGMRAACIFWNSRDCNRFADRDDIDGLTRAINGGTNGLADRRAALVRAKQILL